MQKMTVAIRLTAPALYACGSGACENSVLIRIDTIRTPSMFAYCLIVIVRPQVHYRVRAAACHSLAVWQKRHAPRVNASVLPEQSWHGLASLISIYKV